MRRFNESTEFVVAMVSPWLLILTLMILYECGVKGVINIKDAYVISGILLLSVVPIIIFLIRNRKNNQP